MADPRMGFSPVEIDEAWRDPEFNQLPEDRRISIVSEMDPRFAALSGIDRRRIAATMHTRFSKPVQPSPQRPPTEAAADAALAQSGLPPAAPPDMGLVRAQPVEEGRAEALFRSNPFRRREKALPASPPPQSVALTPPLEMLTDDPFTNMGIENAPNDDRVRRPLSLPATSPAASIPATKPAGVPRNVARQGPYATILQPSEEQEFRHWVSENKFPFDPGPQSDYDLRGLWRALRARDQRAKIAYGKDGKPELPDSWKTPFNPTFSSDSIFAGPDAPKWVGGKLVDSFGRVLKDKDYDKAAGKALDQQQKAAERLANKSIADLMKGKSVPTPNGPPVPNPPLAGIVPGMNQLGSEAPGIQPAPQPEMPKTWDELRNAPGIKQPDVIVDPNTGMDVPVGASPEQWAQFGKHDPVRTGLKSALGGAAQMTLDAPGGLASMAGNTVGSTTLQDAGATMTALGQNANAAFAPPPGVQTYEQAGDSVFSDPHWWASTIGNGIGSMAPLMLSGAGTGALIEGALQKGLIRGALADKVVRYGPSAVSGLSEGILAGGNAYNEAKAAGASEEQARDAFTTVAAWTAATSGPAFAAGAFNEALPLAARIPAGMAAEGLQEVAQGRGEDSAKRIYNPGATMGSQDAENFVGGAFGGALAGAHENAPVQSPRNPEALARAERERKRGTVLMTPQGPSIERLVREDIEANPIRPNETPNPKAQLAAPPPKSAEESAAVFAKQPNVVERRFQENVKARREESAAAIAESQQVEQRVRSERDARQRELIEERQRRRAQNEVTVPEFGASDRDQRVADARDRLSKIYFEKPFNELSNPDRIGIDELVADGLGFSVQPGENEPTSPQVSRPTEQPSQVSNSRNPFKRKSPPKPTAPTDAPVETAASNEVAKIKEVENFNGPRMNVAAPTENSSTPKFAEVADNISQNSKTEPQVEEKKPDREFSSTQVNMPPQLSEKIGQLAARIPDSALTEDGREDEPHVTVKFGLHGNDPEAVRKLLADEPPVRVKLGKVSLFENDDADVVKIDIDSPDLHRLNKKIADAVPHTDTHPTYQPHLTLGYVKPGEGKKFLELNDLEGQEITLNSLTFSGKDRSKIEIPLTGKPAETVQNQGVADSRSHFSTSNEGPSAITPESGQEQQSPAESKTSNPPATKAKQLPAINPTHRPARRGAIRRLRGNPQGMVDEYRKRFGNVFNADDAAELFPEYSTSNETRAGHRTDVHPAAQWVRDEAFRQAVGSTPLQTPVVFLAGGTSSGKSTIAKRYDGTDVPVFDSTLAGYDGAVSEIEAIRKTGRPTVIHYLYRDPVDAFSASLDRAIEKGRTVPISTHAKAHEEARNTAVGLAEKYAGDPLVSVRLSAFKPDGISPISIDELKEKSYAGISDELERIVENRAADLPPHVHRGALEGRTGAVRGSSGPTGQRSDRSRGRSPQSTPAEVAPQPEKRRGPTQRAAKTAPESSPSKTENRLADLKAAELKRLRSITLTDGPNRAPRGMSIGEIDAWQKRGWLDASGIALTVFGEQAVRDVAEMDAESAKGRPFSEYKPSSKRIETPVGRWALTKPIPVKGESWHTNGHFAVKGMPPSYWKADPTRPDGPPPQLDKVLPTKRAAPVKVVGFAPLEGRSAIFFSNGVAIDSTYFDYVVKLHNPVEWASPGLASPVEGYKDGKLVAVVMPIRTQFETLPERIKPLVTPPADKKNQRSGPGSSSPARLEGPTHQLGRQVGDQGVLGFAGENSLLPDELDSIPSTSLPRVPVNRTKIVRNLQDRLKGLAIRTGNFRRPRALGIFKVRENVVRLKRPLDLPTIAHEVGHAVHKYLWGTSPSGADLNSKPLQPFAGELGPLDYDQEKQRPFEGFAEYIRLRLTDPTAASNAAPTFDTWLNTVLDTHPDIRDTLNDARSEILTWQAQPAAVKLGMSINTEPESESRWKQFMNYFSEYEWIDDKVDLKKAVEVFTRLGAKVSDTADAYKLARMVNGSYTRAFHALTKGTVDAGYKPSGASLESILKPIASRPKGKVNPKFAQLSREWQLQMANDGMDDLRIYLVARRMQNYLDQGLETGFTSKQIADAVEATETDELRQAAQDIHDFQDRILQYVVDKKAMTAEVAGRIREKNDFYVPLYRVMDDQAGQALVGRKMIDLGSPVMRRSGSTRDVIDPLESIVRNTYTMMSFADRQEVAQALVKQAGRVQDQGALIESGIIRPSRQVKFNLAEVGKDIREALDAAGIDIGELEQEDLDVMATIYRPNNDPQRSKGVVKVIVDGEPQLFQMAPDLIRGLDSLDRGTAHPLVKLMTPAKNVLTFSATAANPEFILTNFMRDQMTAGFQSRNDFIPFAHGVYGAFKMLTDPAIVDEWERNGGATAAILPLTRDNLRLSVDKMTLGKKDLVLRHPSEFFTLLKDVLTVAGTYSEQSTRLAEYALAKRNGKSEAQAAFDSRDVTLDFERMGHTARAMNQAIPFFAVTLNAGQRFAEMHNPRNPELFKKAMLRGFLGVTLPSMLLWAINHDDDDYKNIEAWKRDFFWLIPTKPLGLSDTFGPFIRIPKPPLWGQLYGSFFERMADGLIAEKPEAFKGFLNTVLQQALPDATAQTFKPIQEVMANYNSFTDRPIETDAMKKLSPVNRYHSGTSETAKAISRGLNAMGIELSPVKVEHLMLGYTAGLGRFAVTTTEELLGLRDDRPEMAPSETPILRAVATPAEPFQSENSAAFYDRLKKLEQKHADALHTGGAPGGPARKSAGLSEEEYLQIRSLRAIAKQLAGIRRQQLEVEHSQELTRHDKRVQIDALSHTREALLRENRDLFASRK